MTQQTADLQVNPSDEVISVGGLTVRFLLTGDNSTGSIAAFELVVPGAQRLPAPTHSHDHYEETIYGIEGVITWTVNGNQIEVGPGQALCIPRGAIHRFDNNTSQDVKALCLITPAAIGPQYFRETRQYSTQRRAARQTTRSWLRSCFATALLRYLPRGSLPPGRRGRSPHLNLALTKGVAASILCREQTFTQALLPNEQ